MVEWQIEADLLYRTSSSGLKHYRWPFNVSAQIGASAIQLFQPVKLVRPENLPNVCARIGIHPMCIKL